MVRSADHPGVRARGFAVSVPTRSHGLLLREWRLEAGDIEAVALASAESAQAGAGSALPGPAPDARTAAQRWICEGYELESHNAGARLAVCSWDGELVLGGLELEVLRAGEFRVGLWLLAAERGCGLESRALAAAIDWLAAARPGGRMWVAVEADDPAALAAVRSCGFSPLGPDPPPGGLSRARGWLFQRALSEPTRSRVPGVPQST